MWSWSLGWGKVTPTIAIGSCPMRVQDLSRIRDEAGVSAVLSLQHDSCYQYWNIDILQMELAALKMGLVFVRHPIRDFDIEDMRRQLPQAIAALAELQQAGHLTYVHCTAGLGRAPLVALGYLILVERWDPDDAIQRILQVRPDAVPAWEALRGSIEDLSSRFHTKIEDRAYELYRSAVNDSAEADWYSAQADVLRAELLRLCTTKARIKPPLPAGISATTCQTGPR